MSLIQYLTSAEKTMLKQRARVHQLLQKGHGVREISRLEKISSTTVVNIKKYLGIKTKLRSKKNNQKTSKNIKVPWKLG